MSIQDETITIRAGEEFDFPRVEQYLRDHIEGLGSGSLHVEQFPSGASNLTYLLQIGDWEGVLRRPPFGPVPPKAHDMERESGLLRKISPVFPFAPKPYFFCQISQTVVETLAQIHAINWQAAGLSEFGHPEGFLARQVKGWIERYFRAQTDVIPQVEPLTRWLAEHVPQSPVATLIHNDFKLNNMLLAADDLTRVTAVLDWEMATIGDPLFDLATTLSYWVNADDPEELRTILPTVTIMPGFISRERFMEIYAQKSGRDLSSLDFYMIFAYFKLAVIIQQIYVRWKRGQTQDERFGVFGNRVRALIEYTAQLAEKTR